MADKELRKMNRAELIEIIYALQQNEMMIREENGELRRRLDEKQLKINKAGSIAEAALSLNRIFEDAQNAADQYLFSLNCAEAQREDILNRAEEEAERLVREAREECKAMRKKARRNIMHSRTAFYNEIKEVLKNHPELEKLMNSEIIKDLEMKTHGKGKKNSEAGENTE